MASPRHFDLVGIDFEHRGERFPGALDTLLAMLGGGGGGSSSGDRSGDPAIEAWKADPGPILTAANSRPGVRRAAAAGTGLLLPGGNSRERYHELIGDYRTSGETAPSGPVVKIHLADIPHEAVLEQIARFGETVLPRLPLDRPQPSFDARSAGDASQA